jgi:uncharacterized protein (TIGR00251 family)
MSRAWCSALPGGIRLAVQITPNAKKSEVIGLLDGALKIRLQAQPIEGKANDALVRYIADALDVPKSAVLITHGHTNKRKILEIRAGHVTVESAEIVLLPSTTE